MNGRKRKYTLGSYPDLNQNPMNVLLPIGNLGRTLSMVLRNPTNWNFEQAFEYVIPFPTRNIIFMLHFLDLELTRKALCISRYTKLFLSILSFQKILPKNAISGGKWFSNHPEEVKNFFHSSSNKLII